MGGHMMKKVFAFLLVLAVVVSFSTQDKAMANKHDELPKIMKTFSVFATK